MVPNIGFPGCERKLHKGFFINFTSILRSRLAQPLVGCVSWRDLLVPLSTRKSLKKCRNLENLRRRAHWPYKAGIRSPCTLSGLLCYKYLFWTSFVFWSFFAQLFVQTFGKIEISARWTIQSLKEIFITNFGPLGECYAIRLVLRRLVFSLNVLNVQDKIGFPLSLPNWLDWMFTFRVLWRQNSPISGSDSIPNYQYRPSV